MRVVHVTDCYLPRLGGIERQVHDLARRQQREGHEVAVVTTAAGCAGTGDPLPVVRPPARFGSSPTRMRFEWALRGRAAVVNGDWDVVHVHASTFSPLAFLTAASAPAAGLPTAVTVHSLWAQAASVFHAADWAARWSRWPVAWSAVSSVAAAPLQRILGRDAEVTVLPNGVDPASWAMPPRDTCRPDRVVVANVGRLAVRKRPLPLLEMLLEARSRVDAGTRLEAVIVGDGPKRRAVERYVERHDMAGWVRLPGAASHDEIRRLYRDVDFYVAPATLESFGIAALEARCAGLPVVAHAGSGVADFITHGEDGLLAADDGDMVDSIVALCDGAVRERMRARMGCGPQGTDWPAVLDATEELYDRARLAVSHARRRPVPLGAV